MANRTALFSRHQPGGVFTINNLAETPGNIFFVNSTGGVDSAGSGQNPDAPFATVNYAISQCTASQGDVIYVMPGHAESISGIAAIAANIAGVSIIGLGNRNNRPTITLHTAVTTIAISAANVTFRNIRIATDIDAVVSVFVITAAGVTLDTVDFVETASCACLQFVLTTSAADDLTIINCRWVQTATAATALQQWIVIIGADRFKIENCYASLKGFATSNPANGVLVGATTASLDVEVRNNRFLSSNSTGAIPISLLANTTGLVTGNFVASAKTAIAGSIGLASCYGANNYGAHVVNKNGLLEPVVDA